jgi:high-affinity nickel permease
MATTNAVRADAEGGATGTGAAARQRAEDVATGIAGAAETVGARLPEAAASTRAAVDEAARRINAGSDEMLTVGSSFSLGMAIGLLVGGANRILVMLALIPAAAMSMTLLDRGPRGPRGKGGAG